MSFLRTQYKINPKFNVDFYLFAKPADLWRPELERGPLGSRLPEDWDPVYYSEYKQAFEPSRFYVNVIKICNRARDADGDREACRRLIAELVAHAKDFTIKLGSARFVKHQFPFPRTDYELSPGWVSAIGNGFLIRALCRIYEEYKDDRMLALAKEFVAAYAIVNRGGRVRPWFTFLDENGFLWFDEYPGDDGYPSQVLNGHIHALYGLLYFLRYAKDREAEALAQGTGDASLCVASSCRFLRLYQSCLSSSVARHVYLGYRPDQALRFELVGRHSRPARRRLCREAQSNRLITRATPARPSRYRKSLPRASPPDPSGCDQNLRIVQPGSLP